MKIWARVRRNNKTVREHTVIIDEKNAVDVKDWAEPVGMLCKELNLSRPIIMNKHVNELISFSMTSFRADDFMERIDFDRLEIELF